MKKVKIAILGTGQIANKLAKALQKTANAKLYAVASRSIEKAQDFAQKYQIAKAYGSYECALEDEEVSLVYIAVPHAFHYELSKKCLLAGKHVLCEKPITVNAKEADELFSLAADKKLFYSEAMWTRFLPAVKKVRDLLDKGCIGELKFLSATTGFNCMNIPRMIEPSLAGGILLDCGIYLIVSTALLFGEDISDISTNAILSDKGVDLRSITTLSYKDGKTATLIMAMDGEFENKITISGDKGYMDIQVPFNWQNIKIYSASGESTKTVDLPPQNAGGYEYMTEAVCNAILNGKTHCEETSYEKTMFVMKLMDILRKKWNLKYSFEQT